MPIILLLGGTILAYWLFVDSLPPPIGKEPFPKNPWGDFEPGDRIIILGLPKSGKTYLAGKLTANVPRIVFFDPYHDYKEAGKATEISADELIENPKILNQSRFRYAVIPNEDDLDEQFDMVTRIVRAAGNCVYVME